MSMKVAVVTGGASGLGLAIARALGQDAWSVALLDMNREALDVAVRALASEDIDVLAFPADVADPISVNEAIAGVIRNWGRIDSVFANAGISAGPGPGAGGLGFAEFEDANWDRVLAVNLSGVARTIRACVPHLEQAGGGSIVITSSSAAIRPTLWVGHAYTAAKAALIPLAKMLAVELAASGIRVNVIAPGAFVTDIGGGRLRDPQTAANIGAVSSTIRALRPRGPVTASRGDRGLDPDSRGNSGERKLGAHVAPGPVYASAALDWPAVESRALVAASR